MERKPSLRKLPPRIERRLAIAERMRHDNEWAHAYWTDIRAMERRYDGMVAERDDQIHRKREARRILTTRPPRDSDGTEMKVGDSLIGHGFVTNVTFPIGSCLTCGRLVNIETGEGHDEARHATQ